MGNQQRRALLPRAPEEEGVTMKRHPAEVTADRLREASERWYDKLDGAERDMIGQLAWALDQIAEGAR